MSRSKKIIRDFMQIAIAAFLFIQSTNAQKAPKASPLQISGSGWKYVGWILDSTNFPYMEEMYNFTFNGDTAISSKTYSKYFYSLIHYYQGTNPDTLYKKVYAGCLRAEGEKVFYIAKDSLSELLLYDYSLKIGDTVPKGLNPENSHFVITDTLTILMQDGSHRLKYILSDNFTPGFIIYGIGYKTGLLNPASFEVQSYNGGVDFQTYCENGNRIYKEEGAEFGPAQNCDFHFDCHAGFTSSHDSLNNNLTYHFYDQSTGNISYWSWDFGDGEYSSVQNPVHTYLQSGVYIVHLYIGSNDSTCFDNTFDTLFVGNGTGCQANFYFYSDSTGTHQLVQFFDISTGNPSHWLWNFGDPASGPNNLSTQQNAIHVFTGPGTYQVCLSITGDSCSSTSCRNVVIPDSVNYYQLYGQVFADNFPLQLGEAIIFSLDTSQNSVPYVDASTIDSSGVYYFTEVPGGNYVIYAIPAEPGGYLPTYYGDVINWEQATIIYLGQPINPYNIHLVPADSIVSGPGSASGRINTGKTDGSLIEKMTLTLLDVNKKPILFSRVNAGGEFHFPTLGYGIYYLHPELAGITSDMVRIEITAAKPHADVIMTFTGDSILGINNTKAGIGSVSAYPNPVTDKLTLSFNLSVSEIIRIEVFTITGQVVYTAVKDVSEGRSTVILPFSELNEGMYLVKIHSEMGINFVKTVIRSR